jgi:hypothetical protein
LSEIELATAIDQLVTSGEAFVSETADRVIVSKLALGPAKQILDLVNRTGLIPHVYDGENADWTDTDLVAAFEPFRVTFAKPIPTDGELLILTNDSFVDFLKTENRFPVWRVALLGEAIQTEGRTYANWYEKVDTPTPLKKKSPRSLVREASGNRIVPQDISAWLLVDPTFVPKTEAAIAWAAESISLCLKSLADEIDSETGELKFKGPPRLVLNLGEERESYFKNLSSAPFSTLQQATSWVFENEREAEVRHILFACEIARSSGASDGDLLHLGKNLLPAFEGAKIAYQMSIAEVGKETLKSLADLRKSVTEDTSKVTEGTRQLAAAVAGALALGFGLIAARLTTTTPRWLLVTVMVIVVLYVITIVFSGYDFIRLQRTLRKQWQSRLYRFLPQSEYDVMVAQPTAHAERTFVWTAAIGLFAVLLIACAIAFDLLGAEPQAQSTEPRSGASQPAQKHLALPQAPEIKPLQEPVRTSNQPPSRSQAASTAAVTSSPTSSVPPASAKEKHAAAPVARATASSSTP